MKALIDGDILRYEVGFGAETWAKAQDGPDAIPSWDMVETLLNGRLMEIMLTTGADEYQLYLTEGETFRYKLAKTKPYKGNRKESKPWHFANLTSHAVNVLDAQVVKHVEADDQLAMDHLTSGGETILCSRDKDLRQIPGPFFSWELYNQPEFKENIDDTGWLDLNGTKLTGTGYAFFCAQVLMGDVTDNIPGLPGCGPVGAYKILGHLHTADELADELSQAYAYYCKDDWEELLLEQGRLCWITRRLNEDGSPELWELGMTE